MNYLRKYRNRYISGIELVSALDDSSFLISPPAGFTDESVRAEYNGVYFTLSSASLSEKTKSTTSGTIYTLSLDFNFPNFVGAELFKITFAKLAEIKITLNTGAVIRLNKNDIALNAPIEVEFQSNLKTVGFSAQLSQIFPFTLNE
ncbi:hypothetical protein [Chryseobacterium sp. MP_3.2]|uniref:hypothetical protein n=1 Tax=Chryseobacterium sp. MP_3.2 TaxID=3071712 RepID=UPI002E07F4AD|nr:hypothetical protein [Chryseobacterium sp. MP_3.2]